jgi:predicted protein tyrosine phosphatase
MRRKVEDESNMSPHKISSGSLLTALVTLLICSSYGEAFAFLSSTTATNKSVGFQSFDLKTPSRHSRIPSISLSRGVSDGEKMRGPDVQPPRPNDNTYWVTDSFVAGEYPADKRGEAESRIKLRQYLDRGIDFFVDLTREGENQPYQAMLKEEATKKKIPVRYRRLSIQDFGVPSKEEMKTILDTIDSALVDNKKVYVHCRGGIGRTGTTVGCFLARHGNTGEEALDEVSRLFQFSNRSYESSCSPETNAQMNFVRDWNE